MSEETKKQFEAYIKSTSGKKPFDMKIYYVDNKKIEWTRVQAEGAEYFDTSGWMLTDYLITNSRGDEPKAPYWGADGHYYNQF